MADLYSVMHREVGPLATFTSYEDAERELERVFGDEPTWLRDLLDRTVRPRRRGRGGTAVTA